MAIAIGQQTDEEFDPVDFTTEINMVHSVPSGTDRLLLVMVSWLNDDLEDISSCYWDPEGANEELTEIASYFRNDDSRVTSFYLTAPTIGASKNVEVIFSSAPLSTGSVVVSAYSLTGVNQTSPIRDEAGEDWGLSTTITSVLTSALSGDFIAACNHIEGNATADFDDSTITMTEVFNGGTYYTSSKHLHGYGTADGTSETIVCTWSVEDHTAGMAVAVAPAAAAVTYEISGITKDSDGVALGSCLCYLCKDNGDNTASFIEYQLSNASTGAYSFTGLEDNDPNYFVIAWKDLTTHVFDVTDYVLTPQEE